MQYLSPNIGLIKSRRTLWTWHVGNTHGKDVILCDDNIKTDLTEVECDDVIWIHVRRDRIHLLVLLNRWVP